MHAMSEQRRGFRLEFEEECPYYISRRMSAEFEGNLHLEIANVLFMDIVGYSKLLTNEQCELLQELNRIVRESTQVRRAEAADELIRLPTGDGIALIFLRSAEAPVECALEISRSLRKSAQLRVRMGIHSGHGQSCQSWK